MLYAIASINCENSFCLMSTFYQVTSHNPNSIAAHFSQRSIGIAVIHKPFFIALCDADQPIRTNSCLAIANCRCLSGGYRNFIGRIKDKNKIIFGAMSVCADNSINHDGDEFIFSSTVSSRGCVGDIHLIRASRENQVSCRLTYWRVARFVSSIAKSSEISPLRIVMICA